MLSPPPQLVHVCVAKRISNFLEPPKLRDLNRHMRNRGGYTRVIKRHVPTLTIASYCIENSTKLNLFQLAVERAVKNTENLCRVLLTSDAVELRCWKAC